MENQNPQPTTPVQDQSSAPTSNINQTLPPVSRKKSKLIYILIALLVLIFLGSAAAFGMKYFNESRKSTILVPPSTTPSPASSLVTNKEYIGKDYSFSYTSDYKLLTNEVISIDGVTVKVPETITLLSPVIPEANTNFQLSIAVEDQPLSKLLAYTASALGDTGTKGTYEIDKKEVNIFKDTTIGVFGSTILYIENNNKVYSISINSSAPFAKIQNAVDQVLSTLKFTASGISPTLAVTNNLKTYTNPLGFSLQYPSNLVYENSSTNTLVGFLEKQNDLMAKRLSIMVFTNRPNYNIYEVLQFENLTPDPNLVYSIQTIENVNTETLSENKTMQELCGMSGDTKLSRIKYAYVRSAETQVLFIPNDSCETYKTDWFTPILKTLKFTN